jgi:membrane associated rhomboid family serine protease
MIDPPAREPMLNVPVAVVALVALLCIVHACLVLLLNEEQTTETLLLFAFIPARYDSSVLTDVAWPGGWAADIWTFFTYALLHGDISHLLLNVVWLLAFGTPVARRFGPTRFLAFMALAAAGGAAAHLVAHLGQLLPMIGASAAISGAMAAAIRFVFQGGGPLGLWRDHDQVYRVPAAPLLVSLREPRVLAFLLVWFGVNIVFGFLSLGNPGVEQAVAWEAHIGGFVTGLVAFSLFDPIRVGPQGDPERTSSVP